MKVVDVNYTTYSVCVQCMPYNEWPICAMYGVQCTPYITYLVLYMLYIRYDVYCTSYRI